MLSKELTESFLRLVRLGIGNEEPGESEDILKIDWSALEALAVVQGLSAVVLDGLDELPASAYDMPVMMKKQWIGEVLQGYEYRYELCCRAIGEMASFYNAHGYKMMVLKGYACSLDWTKPEHRPTGDIDIWLFGRQKEADDALIQENNVKLDASHHHHTVFYWRDFMVENHYDFLNVHHHKSNVELEAILKGLAADDSHYVDLYGERVYLPSANLHALFLLRHAASHFASTGMNLRQLLDWGFFVRAHGNDVDWKWLTGVLEKVGMKGFFNCANAICVEDLSFSAELFPAGRCEPELRLRVLNEILNREFEGNTPSRFLSRVVFRFRRWRANEWKHRLCYKESTWSAFWSGVWSHLLKPSSI